MAGCQQNGHSQGVSYVSRTSKSSSCRNVTMWVSILIGEGKARHFKLVYL